MGLVNELSINSPFFSSKVAADTCHTLALLFQAIRLNCLLFPEWSLRENLEGVVLTSAVHVCSHCNSLPASDISSGMDHLTLVVSSTTSSVAAACFRTCCMFLLPFVQLKRDVFSVCFPLRCEQLPWSVSEWRDLQGEIHKCQMWSFL